MSVFDAYARYYDLLYRDKDYAAEAAYVAGLLARHAPAARSLLELGCGTGIHARHLADLGYSVLGIDRSQSMLEAAAAVREQLPPALRTRLRFAPGDACTYRAGMPFDAVLALFHVASYQTEAADLNGLFQTASAHLDVGGLFIFDFWYGPAVLTQRPETRVKRFADDAVEITRIAEPKLATEANRVDVHYDVFIRDKESDEVQRIDETHRMRYLFLQEVAGYLQTHGFDSVVIEEWMTGHEPGTNTWGVCCTARKIATALG